jgi:hypothetical protein
MLFCVFYCGQQADGTDGAQTHMCRGCSYLPLGDILSPPAEDMIDDTGEESDDDGEKRCSCSRSFPTTNTGLQMFQWMHQKNFIRQHRYLEVVRNYALSLFPDYRQSMVADQDVACLREYQYIVNPPAATSLPNRKRTYSCSAAK